MKRLKDILWGWDPFPIGWRATFRLGFTLWVVEFLACFALVLIINALFF